MKVALIKQELDSHGPWESILWSDGGDVSVAQRWPGKATHWEMTCLLQADWYVIPQAIDTDYIRDSVYQHPQRRKIIENNTRHVTPLRDIPLDNYDVIITFDAIMQNVKTTALLAYFCQEHWDSAYKPSITCPLGSYDLFLDHMLTAPCGLRSLPQAVAFPYLRAPDTVRERIDIEKHDTVWADWRTLTTLGMTELWGQAAESAGRRLESILGVPVKAGAAIFKTTYGLGDTPAWADFLRYYQALGHCRYYVSVGRDSGAGQGAGDAASLNCIVLGERNKAYHRLLCHPECLCDSMIDLPRRFKRVRDSTDLQAEVLAWQDASLRAKFEREPRQLLAQAIEMRNGGVHDRK